MGIYLNTPLNRYEYMKMRITLFPTEIIKQYNLLPLVHQGFVYIEPQKGMYGLPQTGILASKLLQKQLTAHRYAPTEHTHSLWKHHTCPILFLLVVDNFGVNMLASSMQTIHAMLSNKTTKQNGTGRENSTVESPLTGTTNSAPSTCPCQATS